MIARTSAKVRTGNSAARRERVRRGSFAAWALAVGLMCVPGVALAIVRDAPGEQGEWVEFRAARGVGLAGDTWLRVSERGYADLHRRADPHPTELTDAAHAAGPEPEFAPPGRWTRSPRESTYVDLGRSLTR